MRIWISTDSCVLLWISRSFQKSCSQGCLLEYCPSTSTPERTQGWPRQFAVPTFSYKVELIIAQGNAAHEKTGSNVMLTKGQKHDILETLASKMHSFKAYPSEKDLSEVAKEQEKSKLQKRGGMVG